MSKTAQDYTVLEEGFINGVWQEKNAVIPLTPAQARMFLDHGHIAPVKAEQAAVEKKEPAKAAKA